MSHIATNWAVSLRGLSAGEFRVLMVLADCHNPSRGCFPSISYIRDAAEMSNGAVYNNLTKLEEKGHIRRLKRGDKEGKGRLPSRYMLGFEIAQIPEDGISLNSGEMELATPQIPENDIPNSSPLETEPVKEPVTKNRTSNRAREILLSVASEDAVDAFLEHRKAKRAKVTDRAAELIAKDLLDCPDPDAPLFESVRNGWTGVFPKKQKAQEKTDDAIATTNRVAACFGEMDSGPDYDTVVPLLPTAAVSSRD